MRPVGVIIDAPSFEQGAGVRERAEQGLVEQFVAQTADERLGEGILDRLARRDVMPGDLVIVRPSQDGGRGEFGSITREQSSTTTRIRIRRSSMNWSVTSTA